MDPKLLPQEFRRPYLHLLISRLSVDAIPAGSIDPFATGLRWIHDISVPGTMRKAFDNAAEVIDPLLQELAAATSRERGTHCSFGEAAKLAYDQLQAREEQKHPWKKVLREARESNKASKSG